MATQDVRKGDEAAFTKRFNFSRLVKTAKLGGKNKLESELKKTLVSGEAKFCSPNFAVLTGELSYLSYASRN